jgi:DUF4097 and DUF4098 domain-containing protein YvlB
MKANSIILLTAVSCFILFTGVLYADIEDTINRTFDVGPGGTLTVQSDFGSITVNTHSRNTVDVEIIREVDAASEKAAQKILEDLDIQFEKRNDDVTIIADYKKEGSRLFDSGNRRIKMKFEILVPERYNVDLKTAGGSISVSDLEGTAIAATSGGSLKFGNIEGPVTGKTSGGSITLDGCVGDADIKTSGGSINIGDVDGDVDAHTSGGSINITHAKGTVVAKTSGGSINVQEVMGSIDAGTSGGSVTAHISQQPESDCRLTTSGGSVNIYLASDIRANIDAKTSGGRVKTAFPVTVQGELKKNELQAELNGGGPQLYLRTSGGNVNINKL